MKSKYLAFFGQLQNSNTIHDLTVLMLAKPTQSRRTITCKPTNERKNSVKMVKQGEKEEKASNIRVKGRDAEEKVREDGKRIKKVLQESGFRATVAPTHIYSSQ
jgi:hypothetical protein